MLSRDTILTAFRLLSDELGKREILGELNMVGRGGDGLAISARSSVHARIYVGDEGLGRARNLWLKWPRAR